MRRSLSCRTKWALREDPHVGSNVLENIYYIQTSKKTCHIVWSWSTNIFCDWQLGEANDLLRAESDTVVRLRKSHTEMVKSMSQLEGVNREVQEKSRAAESARQQLEKELLQLQTTLDTERRTCSQGSEEIRELQGKNCPLPQLAQNHFLLCTFLTADNRWLMHGDKIRI